MKKVLVVEDDKFLGNAYKAGFEGEGLQVEIAFDGEDALAAVERFSPDVILLDILIPKIDGFEVLARLKSDQKTKHIPVIIASNLGQQQDIERGLELGASDYIVKSESSVTEILLKLKTLLKES